MAEKTKLITQLRDAKNLIEQLEQDKVTNNKAYDTKICQGAQNLTFSKVTGSIRSCAFQMCQQLLP